MKIAMWVGSTMSYLHLQLQEQSVQRNQSNHSACQLLLFLLF